MGTLTASYPKHLQKDLKKLRQPHFRNEQRMQENTLPFISFFIIFKQMWRYIHDNTKFWTPLSKVFTSTLSLYRSVYKTISYSPIDSYLHLTIQQSLNGDQINICSIKMITGRGRGPGTLRGSASVSERGDRFPSRPMASFEWDGRVALIANGAVRTQTEAVSVLWGQVPLETSSQSHAKLDMTSSITG